MMKCVCGWRAKYEGAICPACGLSLVDPITQALAELAARVEALAELAARVEALENRPSPVLELATPPNPLEAPIPLGDGS